jgi:DNA-binding Xre family transcriptional regulator
MKNLQSFNEFVNESNINEAKVRTLDSVVKDDQDGKDGYDEIAKILGTKPSDILVYDADDHGNSKEFKAFDKAFIRGDFKDAKAPEYSDYNMANVGYNKKLNVVSSYAGGYLTFFAKK